MKKIIFFIILVISCTLVISCKNQFIDDTSKTLGNSMQNVGKGAPFAQYKGWTFGVIQNYNSTRGLGVTFYNPNIFKLVKWKDGSNELVDLHINFEVGSINVVNDYIYFLDRNKYNLCRTDINGKNMVIIKSEVSGVFIIDGNWIYFNKDTTDINTSLVRMRLDGSEEKTILENQYQFFLQGEWIYYIEVGKYTPSEGILRRVKIDGTDNSKIILNDEQKRDYTSVGNFVVDHGWIYFTNWGGTYKVQVDGQNLKKISTEYFSLMIYNNSMYYTIGSVLYSADLDGKNSTQIADKISYSSFYLLDGVICGYLENNDTLFKIEEKEVLILKKPYSSFQKLD